MKLFKRKDLTALMLVAVPLAMIALSYFGAVPLYRLFCQVTGYGGTTQVARQAPGAVASRVIAVRFNTDVGKDLPWNFEPLQREVTVHPGETGLAFFRAENLSQEPIVGSAAFNVTPQKSGIYFNKIECFCFTEQFLGPGESEKLGVTFFVDPDIVNDRNMSDLDTITLSYTFFNLGPEARDAYLKAKGRLAGGNRSSRGVDGRARAMERITEGTGGSG